MSRPLGAKGFSKYRACSGSNEACGDVVRETSSLIVRLSPPSAGDHDAGGNQGLKPPRSAPLLELALALRSVTALVAPLNLVFPLRRGLAKASSDTFEVWRTSWSAGATDNGVDGRLSATPTAVLSPADSSLRTDRSGFVW